MEKHSVDFQLTIAGSARSTHRPVNPLQRLAQALFEFLPAYLPPVWIVIHTIPSVLERRRPALAAATINANGRPKAGIRDSVGIQIALRQLHFIRAPLVHDGSIPTTRQANLATCGGMDQQALAGANQEIVARRLRTGTVAPVVKCAAFERAPDRVIALDNADPVAAQGGEQAVATQAQRRRRITDQI